ncbi:MAG: hypothetical protein H0W71_03790 [Sphingomonas sp.]|nr:hypothetical protein [Sphingomonas sp.]
MTLLNLATRVRLAAAIGLAALTMVPASAQSPTPRMSESEMRAMLAKWPMSAQMAAADMMKKYGPPQEVTAERLKWRNNGPWKYTIISNYETPHRFPAPHTDVMTQAIAYRVPAAMFDDLAAFDGSVTADRTQGHLAARCEMEGANFLAINLAHDVVTRRKGVPAARAYYARAISAFKKTGLMDSYMQRLQFTPPRRANDPDIPARM